MTEGHRHRTITVKSSDSLWVRWLRKPRWTSTDRRRVDKSRFAWGVNVYRTGPVVYSLSILGILHGWFGLTLYWEDE